MDKLIAELRTLIGDLGKDGGLISPSVYDTAQVLRLYPPKEGVEPGLEWLLAQQHADGGWGEESMPTARDIPTLAAMLALHAYRRDKVAQAAIDAGREFLQQRAAMWQDFDIDALPLAAEMILPYLFQEARAQGLAVECSPCANLLELRERKLQSLAKFPFTPNSAPSYSWEALGQPFTVDVLDPTTGVGHSPAATAAWLKLARDKSDIETLRAQAQDYLRRAHAATQVDIPGVVPVAFPITAFELAYGLYVLELAGLLDHPQLQETLQPQAARMYREIQEQHGLSFGDNFVPDVDGTSTAVIALRAMGYAVDKEVVMQFWRGDHFYTYIHELNPSVLSNAHALHALLACGSNCETTEQYLLKRRNWRGVWDADKWHTSWRFTTMETVAALVQEDGRDRLVGVEQALVADQLPEGGWGFAQSPDCLETSHAILALHMMATHGNLSPRGHASLGLGATWLHASSVPQTVYPHSWLGKEIYSPYRVDRVYHLSALLARSKHNLGQHRGVEAMFGRQEPAYSD